MDRVIMPASPLAAPGTQPSLPACRLVRLIGKTPEFWSVEDLVDVVKDHGVRLVSLMHIGGDGWLKTLDFVPRDLSHLHDILSGGERADGSSIFAGKGISAGASDIVLRPRVATAFLHPFAAQPTLVLLCSHYGRNGAPLPESPDTVVHRAFARVKEETGLELHALGEVEFFLGKRGDESDIYGATERGYHASSPFVFGEPLRRQALLWLADIGVPVKYGHSEVGYIPADGETTHIWEQHEIELALQPLPAAADAVVIAQWLLRNLAHGSGMQCSFEPIMRAGHAGSGMHFHLSPVAGGVHQRTGTDEGQLRPYAKWLIGGLVRHGTALMAFGNRSPQSFARLVQGKEAPNTLTWGRYNRNALVRLPIVATDEDGRAVSAETIEFRLPDGSAHPHVLLAGIAQAMLAGRAIESLDEVLEKTSAAKATEATPVPRNFGQVAAALRAHRAMLEEGGVFPPNLLDKVAEGLDVRSRVAGDAV